MVEGEFALCMSLYHGYELLQQHGLRSLHSYLESLMSGEKGCSKTKHTLQSNQTFCNLMEELRNKFDPVKLVFCKKKNVFSLPNYIFYVIFKSDPTKNIWDIMSKPLKNYGNSLVSTLER